MFTDVRVFLRLCRCHEVCLGFFQRGRGASLATQVGLFCDRWSDCLWIDQEDRHTGLTLMPCDAEVRK